jgi:hypothetical protein
MKPGTIDKLVDRVRHARTKHPEWRKTSAFAIDVAALEWQELQHAVKWESKARQKEEALDLCAVLLRFVEGDAE